MDEIDMRQPFNVENQAEPEVDFSLEEFDHYCELLDRLLMALENENWTVADEMRSEPAVGSASQHSNLEDYLDEFDWHEIRGMRTLFGISDWMYADTSVEVKEDLPRNNEVLADKAPTEVTLDLFSEADRRYLLLRKPNIRELRTIQKTILLEEELRLSLEKTLAQVLSSTGNSSLGR
jgi:hypothetical protein